MDFNDDLKDPFVDIDFTYAMYRFQLFWNFLVIGEARENLNSLYEYGLRQMNQFKIDASQHVIKSSNSGSKLVTFPANTLDPLIHPSELIYLEAKID